MDNRETGKVIPFSLARSIAALPPDAADSLDLALARRRGLDSVEPVLRAKPAPAPRSAATLPPSASEKSLGAPALSAMFIASLDDLIGERETSWVVDAPWPQQPSRQLEKVAIDIVDMLFGFILEDPQIPASIKESLLSAQLPMLRMATREIAFFADWQHPARRLLNDVAPLFRAHGERGGNSETFVAEFSSGMNRVLDELDPNGTAFAMLHVRLREFVNGTSPQTAASTAWQRAEAAARSFLERPLPQIAREFVVAHWIDVLGHTAERYADDSPQWQETLTAIEDLAWSLTPKREEEDRFRLIGLIPALLTRLNRGLDLIELPREERRPFFDTLIEIHAAMLRVETAPPAAKARYESVAEQVARLQRGDWVELRLDDGSCSRERLTWISPQRGILVFSNHQGQRAIQIAPEDLADLVRERQATLIFDQTTEDGRNSA